jgi:Na+-driven multidrug efflux pump
MDTLKQNADFLRQTFLKSVFPCMLTILSVNINVFVDGILVGNQLGARALAAINLSLPLYLMLCVAGSFLASGTAISAAREIGNDQMEKSREYYCTCVVSTFWISVLITVAGLLFREPLVAFLCSDAAIRPYVMEYVVITLIGTLPKIMIYVPFWYLRLDGQNSAVTVMMSVMSIGNVLLDILFVYGWKWGVFGAGLASVIATTAAFLLGVARLLRRDSSFTFRPFVHKRLSDWREIAAAGTPSALNNLFSTVRLLLINSVLMRCGGGAQVAVFTAVNGIAGFGECITLGIPQAANAMLGVYSGERDNGSCTLLVKLEWAVGSVAAGIFLVCIVAASGGIQRIYGLEDSLFIPLLWMSVSVFPALFCNILSGYYNMAKKNLWANGIIFLRVIAMTWVGLALMVRLELSTYSFLLFAELATVAVWFLATGLYHRRHAEDTRFLLMDTSLERTGQVLNFSVDSDVAQICDASVRIMEFCKTNGMDVRKTMCVQLALEEIMTLITKVNEQGGGEALSFDLRAYSLEDVTGIRIRYAGKEFDPFRAEGTDEDLYMGIRMIKKMVESTTHRKTFGVNTLQVILRKE